MTANDFRHDLYVKGAPVPTAYYFYVLKDDHIVAEFCVANAQDERQSVLTAAPDGTLQVWKKAARGDLLVFYPPDGYTGDRPMQWMYDRRLQIGEPMPRDLLEKYALRNKHSVYFDAGDGAGPAPVP